jgi:hypothetical protein
LKWYNSKTTNRSIIIIIILSQGQLFSGYFNLNMNEG